MIREIKGEILSFNIQNPIFHDYDDAIFQIEIRSEDGWNAQLMFKMEQVIDILREFDVRFVSDLLLKECHLLDDDDNTLVPMGIKYQEDSEYIEVHNQYFIKLWK